jgi:hypothetical protein
MGIDLASLILQLEANSGIFQALVSGLSDAQMRWRPDENSWSLLEVVNHLRDEEMWDFRRRTRLTLETPEAEWPPIHPGDWVTKRGYNQRECEVSLDQFVGERTESIQWLRGLSAPALNWDSRHESHGRSLRAGDLMASWLAHDFLHLRQINELRYLWHAAQSASYDVSYAGDWQPPTAPA